MMQPEYRVKGRFGDVRHMPFHLRAVRFVVQRTRASYEVMEGIMNIFKATKTQTIDTWPFCIPVWHTFWIPLVMTHVAKLVIALE
jgi:hypothetical protein